MDYKITHKDHISNDDLPHIEAIVSAEMMANPSNLPSEWPSGSIIYTADYTSVKCKDLDGNWVVVE